MCGKVEAASAGQQISLLPGFAAVNCCSASRARSGYPWRVRRASASMTASSVIVMTAFVASKIVGLLRDRAIAHQFGASEATDAYYAAFKIPDLLFTLIAGGALVSAFLPVFADALARDDDDAAWRIASGVTNLVFLTTAVLAGLAFVFALPLIERVAPGFDAANQAIASSLMRWILISTLIFAISGIQMGILNAFRHFLLPAIAPVMYNAGILGGAVFLAPQYGVHGLAYGVIIGALLHLFVKVPGLIRYGFRYAPVLGLRDPGVRHVLVLMWPRVVGLGVVQIALLVTLRLASQLEAGSISAFQFSWVIAQMPQTILGTAVGVVAFPTLAHLAALNRRDELREVAVQGLRAMIALSLPAAVGLYVLAGPAIDLLLRSGEFSAAAADLTVGPLRMFALGLVGHVTLELLARIYYAQKDTLTPLYIAAAAMGLNVALAFVLVGPLRVAGLALANSIAVTVEVVLCLIILHKRGGIGGRSLADAVARSAAASAIMALVVLSTLHFLPDGLAVGPLRGPLLEGLASTAVGGAAGAVAYFCAAWAFGLTEVTNLPRRFLARRAV
jgi:putative peptidoglycan lipid II flippase